MSHCQLFVFSSDPCFFTETIRFKLGFVQCSFACQKAFGPCKALLCNCIREHPFELSFLVCGPVCANRAALRPILRRQVAQLKIELFNRQNTWGSWQLENLQQTLTRSFLDCLWFLLVTRSLQVCLWSFLVSCLRSFVETRTCVLNSNAETWNIGSGHAIRRSTCCSTLLPICFSTQLSNLPGCGVRSKILVCPLCSLHKPLAPHDPKHQIQKSTQCCQVYNDRHLAQIWLGWCKKGVGTWNSLVKFHWHLSFDMAFNFPLTPFNENCKPEISLWSAELF